MYNINLHEGSLRALLLAPIITSSSGAGVVIYEREGAGVW